MIEGLPFGIMDLGLGGLLTLAVAIPLWLLYQGKLVPRRVLQDEQEEKRHWRQAAQESEASRREIERQLGQVVQSVSRNTELAELSLATLQAIRDRADTS